VEVARLRPTHRHTAGRAPGGRGRRQAEWHEGGQEGRTLPAQSTIDAGGRAPKGACSVRPDKATAGGGHRQRRGLRRAAAWSLTRHGGDARRGMAQGLGRHVRASRLAATGGQGAGVAQGTVALL
jgi:hypothetical protein